MRIGVSLFNFRPGRVGGTETYLRQLVAALAALEREDELVALVWPGARAIVPAGVEQAAVSRGDFRMVAARILEAFTPYRALFAERALRQARLDVVLFPQQSIFPKRAAGPCVMTVHDVQHLVMPENFGLFDKAFRAGIYGYSLSRADHIISISQFTRRQLIQRCGVPAEKVTAIPQGLAPLDAAAVHPTGLVEGPYLYYPGATYPHKGHRVLLESFATLRRRGLDMRLVLTGQRTALWDELRKLLAGLGIEKDVLHLGFVGYGDVLGLYKSAAAVVFPTTYEGFGLPVLEAASMGKKVITSDLEVFEEIGVPREWRIDFAAPDALAAALDRPGPTRLTCQPWTWEQTARATLDVLRRTARS